MIYDISRNEDVDSLWHRAITQIAPFLHQKTQLMANRNDKSNTETLHEIKIIYIMSVSSGVIYRSSTVFNCEKWKQKQIHSFVNESMVLSFISQHIFKNSLYLSYLPKEFSPTSVMLILLTGGYKVVFSANCSGTIFIVKSTIQIQTKRKKKSSSGVYI